jgi:hypothetical protein
MDPKFLTRVAVGQFVSLLLVGTGATSQLLADRLSAHIRNTALNVLLIALLCNRGFEAPTFQSFVNYLLLALVYIPISLNAKKENSVFSHQGGGSSRGMLIAKFFILAVVSYPQAVGSHEKSFFGILPIVADFLKEQ